MTAVAWLLVLVLVLELASKHSASKGTNNSMTPHLVATKVPCSTSSQCAHQPPVAFSLRVGICGAIVLLAWLAIRVRSLRVVGVLVLLVGALLRELVRRSSTWILLLVVLAGLYVSYVSKHIVVLGVLPLLLIWIIVRGGGLALAVLEAALRWWAIRLLVPLLLFAVIALGLWLLRRITRLLVVLLVVFLRRCVSLTWCGRAVLVRGILIVVLVVLVVGVRHVGDVVLGCRDEEVALNGSARMRG